jgi:hypothetical protein
MFKEMRAFERFRIFETLFSTSSFEAVSEPQPHRDRLFKTKYAQKIWMFFDKKLILARIAF